MSKQKQILPRLPYVGTMELFDTGGITIYYEEWSRTSKGYQPRNVDCATQEEADQVIEQLTCTRILEPLIRFLTGQEQALLHDFSNSQRKGRVGQCKKALEKLIKPTNQTAAQLAKHFYDNLGKLFVEALPGKRSKYYDKGQALLNEVRSFTRQHFVKSVGDTIGEKVTQGLILHGHFHGNTDINETFFSSVGYAVELHNQLYQEDISNEIITALEKFSHSENEAA